MKANEAPEKLYFPIDDALETYARKDSDEEIEYTRTDAFVEKARKWFDDNFYYNNRYSSMMNGVVFTSMEEMFEDFKNAMKQ